MIFHHTIGLNCKNVKFDEPEILTKKCIFPCAHKFWDPIGITCPAALLPKRLLQQTWESKIEWDEEVSEDLKKCS